MSELNSAVYEEYGNNFRVLKSNDQTCELQTIIRDKNTTRNDFKFYADRLIRLIIEESLNQLPYKPYTVITPIGFPYEGLQYEKGNCGVSIVRSGEAMEQVFDSEFPSLKTTKSDRSNWSGSTGLLPLYEDWKNLD